jgi:hypothetical protein
MARMKTADIFICETCGLPIRNPEWSKIAGQVFICPRCEVCRDELQRQMDVIERRLHELLMHVVKKLFQYNHNGTPPSDAFLQAIEMELTRRNPVDDEIDKIKICISQSKSSGDGMLQHIIRSEKMLSEFFYRSSERRFIGRSPTILRHWAALRRKMRKMRDSTDDTNREFVLQQFTRHTDQNRYVLNLERMSKLVGDNPVGINRNCAYYENAYCWEDGRRVTRATHLKKHISDLIAQTDGMDPSIKDRDLKGILRFAGNACFITEADEVIEFREYKTQHLCKYLLQDHILIVLNDLRGLDIPAADPHAERPLAELVSIHPRKPAAGDVIEHLSNGRYLPNCVDLGELTTLSNQIEEEVRR